MQDEENEKTKQLQNDAKRPQRHVFHKDDRDAH